MDVVEVMGHLPELFSELRAMASVTAPSCVPVGDTEGVGMGSLPPEPRQAPVPPAPVLQSQTLNQTLFHPSLIMCDLGLGMELSKPQFPHSIGLAPTPSCLVWLQ